MGRKSPYPEEFRKDAVALYRAAGGKRTQLLFTQDWLTGVRAIAHDTISERASHAYESAYVLSGGRELHRDAHSVAVTNLLHCTTHNIVAFALHHRPSCPTSPMSSGRWSTQPRSLWTSGSARTRPAPTAPGP